MKKLTTIFLAAALLFAVAGQASASTLETSGDYRARYWYTDNYLPDQNGHWATADWWDSRLRLNADWNIAEGVKVHTRADLRSKITADTGVTGEAWGENIKHEQIYFDHLNLQFVWPGTPLAFTLGRQDVTWGLGYYAAADNRDRAKIVAKLDNVSIVLAYDEFKETLTAKNAGDAYDIVLGVISKIQNFDLGLLGLYYADKSHTVVGLENYDRDYFGLDFFFKGKLGMVDLKGEFVYASGTDEGTSSAVKDVDIEGIGAYLGVFVPAGPVTIGVEGAYAQGNDPGTKENEGLFKADYQGPFNSIILYNFLDYPGYQGDGGIASSYANDTNVANAMAGKLSVTWPVNKQLTLIGAALYAVADQTAKNQDDAIGTEFDVIAVYNVSDNVTLTAGAGYLVVGDYYEGKMGAKANDTPDNPFGAMVAFSTKF